MLRMSETNLRLHPVDAGLDPKVKFWDCNCTFYRPDALPVAQTMAPNAEEITQYIIRYNL